MLVYLNLSSYNLTLATHHAVAITHPNCDSHSHNENGKNEEHQIEKGNVQLQIILKILVFLKTPKKPAICVGLNFAFGLRDCHFRDWPEPLPLVHPHLPYYLLLVLDPF